MSMARQFLMALFKRSQSAVSRGRSEYVELKLTASSCPELFQTRSIEDAYAFRSELELAERAGAVHLKPKATSDPPFDVASAQVNDLSQLARILDMPVRRDAVARAREALGRHIDDFPVLGEVLARWQKGQKVRGQEADDAIIGQIQDAIRVITKREGAVSDELLRRVSVRLFQDSKRIEAIAKWLDLLWSNSITPSGLDDSEIFSVLGLHKEPLPVLISGNLTVLMASRAVKLALPYLGFPPAHINAVVADGAPTGWRVLTIENRQTFHEFAEAASDQPGLILLYTGGMPSPSWKRVYMLLLKALPSKHTEVFHFGDLDLGGMRISAVISSAAVEAGFSLQPWMMDPATLTGLGHVLKPAPEAVSNAMSRTCRTIGWEALADQIEAFPGTLEQEAVLPDFPVVAT